MLFIKEINSENNEDVIFAVSEDSFEKMNYTETYGNYGQQVDDYDAGSYSLHNSACDAVQDCIEAIKNKFIQFKDSEIEISGDELRIDGEYFDWFSGNSEIESFVNDWEEGNVNHEQVKAYNYWNGNNWASIIIEAEYTDDAITHEVIEDENLIEKLEAAIENKEEFKTGFGLTYYNSECGYYIVEDNQAATFEMYSIIENESWKASVIRGEVENY